ncbi:hypothetical protein TNCV_4378081 [Trichonephila clavipes]|nr:hypothetical protein TNCV_4378081 [Trichonephila clavipes]
MSLSGPRMHLSQMARPSSGHFFHHVAIPFFLKKPTAVLRGVRLLNQTGPTNEYSMELGLVCYHYSPNGIEDQNTNNVQ